VEESNVQPVQGPVTVSWCWVMLLLLLLASAAACQCVAAAEVQGTAASGLVANPPTPAPLPPPANRCVATSMASSTTSCVCLRRAGRCHPRPTSSWATL
jgi:hypothetical protein